MRALWRRPATRRSACSRSRGRVRALRRPAGRLVPGSLRRGGVRRRRLADRLRAAGAADLLRAADAVTVFLVGAGPGDPGLLTVRARELIDAADVILYDRLIPPGVLDGVRAELVYVGKIGGGPQMPQAEIDRLLVQYGTGERTVVRLKGGDPFVFGRGGEEAPSCSPPACGRRSSQASPRHRRLAAAGIPVTHRLLASAVAFVTGHGPRRSPRTALTGARSRTSRARWCSTWRSRRCRGGPRAHRARAFAR